MILRGRALLPRVVLLSGGRKSVTVPTGSTLHRQEVLHRVRDTRVCRPIKGLCGLRLSGGPLRPADLKAECTTNRLVWMLQTRYRKTSSRTHPVTGIQPENANETTDFCAGYGARRNLSSFAHGPSGIAQQIESFA